MNFQIYADNAATTKLDDEAFESMLPWLKDEYGNASQPYSFARKPKRALANAREVIAACINALPEEIFFTSGGTESDNWAIKGFLLKNPEKKTTVTSSIEHHAVLNACATIEKLGYPVLYVEPDSKGIISPDVFESYFVQNIGLASIMLANNEIGSIQPISRLSRIAHDHGALFHCDAVQAVGHIPVDVQELGVDMLSSSAHKFNGPKGVGFMYLRKGVVIDPFNNGGGQERGLRAGTENVACIVGMARALEINCADLKTNTSKLMAIENRLLETLKIEQIDFIRNGDSNHLPGNVSISIKNVDGEMLLHRLDLMGIEISTGSACDSKNAQVSHVIKAIQVPDEYKNGTIRISFGKYNTEQDAEIIAHSIARVLKRFD